MPITKNKNEIRLTSGNNFKVYYNSEWKTLGNILSGKLTRSEDTADIKFADGESFKKRTTRMATLQIVLAQVSKEILDALDGILDTSVKLYYYNGVANSKYMEFYAPEAEGYANFDLEMKGDSHQILTIEFSIYPQDANANVTPSTGLPDDAKSHETGTVVTGTNPYYVLIETAV